MIINKTKIYMNGEGMRILMRACVKRQEHNQDSIIMVSGEVGSGKSNTSLYGMGILKKEHDFTINDSNILFSIREYLGRIKSFPERSALTLDEAPEGSSADFNTKENKKFIAHCRRARAKSRILFLNFENPARFLKPLIQDRILGCLFVVKRGHVKWFDREKLKEIFDKMKIIDDKSIYVLKKYPPVWEDYNVPAYDIKLFPKYYNKKIGEIDNFENECQEEFGEIEKEKFVSKVKAMKLLGIGKDKFKEYITTGVLSCRTNASGSQYQIPLSEIDDIMSRVNLKSRFRSNTHNKEGVF